MPVRLEIVSGNGQLGAPGAALSEPLRVRLSDEDGQPIARLRVEWTAAAGSGEAEPRNSFSDENGIAQTTWILGPATGPKQVRASVRGGITVTFDATAQSPTG